MQKSKTQLYRPRVREEWTPPGAFAQLYETRLLERDEARIEDFRDLLPQGERF